MMLRRLPVLAVLAFLAPCSAVAQQVTPQELEALARYSQTLQQHYQAGMAISMEMDAAEEVIDRYAAGDLAEAEMRDSVTAARAAARSATDEFEQGLAAIGERPRLADRKRDKAMQAYLETVRGIQGHLETQLALLDRLMSAALAGDTAAYNDAAADSLALAGRMIVAENVSVEASAIATGPRHPQTGLSEAVIGSNLAMLAALILTEDSMRGREPRISEARGAIEQGLERAGSGVKTGRHNAEAMWASMSSRPVVTEADELSKRFLRELADAYRTAFDIESEIGDAMRTFLDAVVASLDMQAGAADPLATTTASFQEEILRLVDLRMDEQARRYRMVQEFSAALAAVQ
jgi:hypothetical protein